MVANQSGDPNWSLEDQKLKSAHICQFWFYEKTSSGKTVPNHEIYPKMH
jgi:hypothetical protein